MTSHRFAARPTSAHHLASRPAKLMATVSATALLLVAPGVHAKPLGGAQPAPSAAAVAAAQSGAQEAARAARQGANALQRATLTIQAQQAGQQAAREAARAMLGAVPNGLGAGGLQAAAGAVPGSELWQGAKLPTQFADGDRVKVGIEQTQSQAILTWDTFNIGAKTDLTFDQKGNRDWVALNRVLGSDNRPSQILGSLKADGSVYVINQNGIVFRGASQVNVGALIASTAKITNEQFLKGIYSTQTGTVWAPSFTDAAALLGNGAGGGVVRVEAGAEISTHVPGAVTAGGGFVLLMGGQVENAGSITTPNGQTQLAAGDDFVLRRGYGTDANIASTTRGNEIAPLFRAGSAAGLVRNSGLIFASQGDITLAGRTIQQDGVLVASTSVNTRGTIHLLNAADDALGSVTLGAGSLTTIIPELESTETALNSQRDALIAASLTANQQRGQAASGAFNNLSVLADRLDQSRIEIVSGGDVVFKGAAAGGAGSLTIAQGGQIAVSAGRRVFTEAGSVLDVSGVRDVVLAMASNNLKVNIQGNELRDSPVNRDNDYLKNADIWLDLRNLVYVPSGTGGYDGERYYTPGGLLEVGGYLANTAHGIGEWSALGGTITLSAPEVVAQAGSVFDISGGSLKYEAGYILSSNFLGSDGRRYGIDDARADMLFYGIGQGWIRKSERWGVTEVWTDPLGRGRVSKRWEEGYTVGRDAGRLNLSTPTAVFEGEILADVVEGERQASARPDDTTDGYKLGQSQVAKGGTLALGRYTALGLTDAYQSTVRIGDVAAITEGLDAQAALPAERANTVLLDAGLLNEQKLGGLSIATRGAVTVERDLTLADGGSLTITAPTVDIRADITARSGSVSVGNVLRPEVVGGTPLVLGTGALTLHDGATIDVRGLWLNGLAGQSDLSGLAFLDGGTVALASTGKVVVAAGSAIDASSGAALGPDGFEGGRGGDVRLGGYDQAGFTGGELALAGTIRGYGVAGGGTLTLNGGKVVIGAGGTATAADALLLTPELFRTGFSAYAVNGVQSLEVAEGTALDVAMPVYRLGAGSAAVPTGADPAAVLELWTPPLYQENATKGALTQRAGADLLLQSSTDPALAQGQVTVGRGATISVDPGRAITVQSPGQITVDGRLVAPGGTVEVLNLFEEGLVDPMASQRSIWIGDHAFIDVAARAYTALDNQGRVYGVVPDGGAITIGARTKRQDGTGIPQANGDVAGAASAFIVVRPGAVLDASGTSAVLDLPGRSGFAQTSTRVAVASAGGTIALNSLNGLYLDGTMRAFAGGAGAVGGTLVLTLETPRYVTPFGAPATPDELRYLRELEIAHNYQASGSDGALRIGTGRISVEQIKAGGFDTLSAYAEVLRFKGNVDLSLGRGIELYQALLASDGSAAQVRLAAPHIAFRAVADAPITGAIYPRVYRIATAAGAAPVTSATLVADADLIDIESLRLGSVRNALQLNSGTRAFAYTGFDSATLNSRGDVRIIGGPYIGGAADAGASNASGVTGSRVLEINAAQIYPVTGGFGTIAATDLVRFGRTTTETPDLPYSVFGRLHVYGKAIEQGGVLRAPLGLIKLGAAGTSTTTPVVTETVRLLPGSITSAGANGLAVPYGGTVDGITYSYNGEAVKALSLSSDQGPLMGVWLAGKSFTVNEGALIDVSGGGEILGAGFISGRGGSVDVLATPLVNANPAFGYSTKGNGVFAIVPGAQPYAPIDAGGSAAPGIGRQVTIPEGVPGLKAGTYTLMPARYALLPDAYRVEIGNTTTQLAAPAALGNGSWIVAGLQGTMNTGQRDTLPTQMILTSGQAVRSHSQYNETSYSDFLIADAARLGGVRPVLPVDGKTFFLDYVAQPSTIAPALTFDGKALFTPGKGGYGGILRVDGDSSASALKLEIIPEGGVRTAGFVSIEADELNAVGAVRMSLGSNQYFRPDLNYITVDSNTNTLVVRSGAVLQAPEIFLGAGQGGITIEDGARLTTLGQGGATPFSAADGFTYSIAADSNLLALSNGLLDVLSINPGSGDGAGIAVGKAELYTEGSLVFATSSNGKLLLDRDARYGAKYLTLALPSINIGENAAIDAAIAAGVLPSGLILNQQVLASLLQGNQGIGVPKLETLILSAGRSINFFGSIALDTIDPATGKSSLAELVLNTPAIYGLGDAGDTARITTGTLVWNGVSDGVGRVVNVSPGSIPPPAVVPGGAGTGSGRLDVVADEIVFGYRKFTKPDTQLTLDHLALGFATVNLEASQRITANNRNTFSVYQSGTSASTYAGGNLNLVTPLLTGEGASINRMTAGGALTLTGTGAAAARTDVTGAEIGLKGRTVSLASTIALPSGKLTVEADNDVLLADGARIDMAGREITMVDVQKYSWGGDVVLTSNHGNVTQAAGSVIDLSARNNDGGTLKVTAIDAVAGMVALDGTILGATTGEYDAGGTMVPYLGGEIDVRAQTIADFAGLNARLNAGSVFGARSFQIKKEGVSLAIGDELKASRISVSVDGGSLAVYGRVDASGEQVGSIRLSARDGLALASSALLDAHGTRLRVDSYGQPIDAPNRAIVEVTSAAGLLQIAPGATIDVRSADAALRGTVELNAPRTTETGGDIAIDARGPVAISGARSIAVNGFWRYIDAPAGTPAADGTPTQIINQAYLDTIHARSATFIDNALDNDDLENRLGGLRAYGSAYHLRPGVEIASATDNGNLTVEGDLDLSGYRYGPGANPVIRGSGEVGKLSLRAGGDLTVNGSISDGFAPPPSVGPAGNLDDNGWRLPNTAITLSSDAVVYSGTLLGGASGTVTAIPAGPSKAYALTFDITVRAGASLRRGIAVPFAFDVNAAVAVPTWAASTGGWVATANIYNASGALLYTAGQKVNVSLPAGTRFAVGTVLPSSQAGAPNGSVAIRATLITKGTLLNVFSGNVMLNASVVLRRGDVLPAGIVLAANATANIFLRPAAPAGATQGKMWAIAPMLDAGSQSWSMRLTSGADATAADSRRLNAVGTGDMVLNDLHYSGPSKNVPAPSVIRTGTGDLDFNTGGDFRMDSLFGIYTAGTQSANVGAEFNLARGKTTVGALTSVLGSTYSGYESLVIGAGSVYQAWYPVNGGNLALNVEGSATGLAVTGTNDPGNWLWRQGGDLSGSPTAWWINFGTYTNAGLKGFTGLGTLGGGNVDVSIAGDAGVMRNFAASGANAASQALNIAIGGSGRMMGGGLLQTGGGDIKLRIGGGLNPLDPNLNNGLGPAFANRGGVIANLRGGVDIDAGAIGRIDLSYGWSDSLFKADPRPADPRTANFANYDGGPTLFVGDATASLASRGDLVLLNAGDPGRASQSYTTPFKVTQNGVTTSYDGGGTAAFSLWTDNTAIDLFAAGGNLTPVAMISSVDYPATLRAVAAEGSIYYGVVRDSSTPVAISVALAPSAKGQLEMLARDSIYTVGMPFSMSGADPSSISSPFKPAFIGRNASNQIVANNLSLAGDNTPSLWQVAAFYAFGPNTISGDLHAGDAEPQRFYAVEGDIVGLRTGEIYDFTWGGRQASSKPVNTWYAAAKPVRIIAGRDVVGSGEIAAFDANGRVVYPGSRYGSNVQSSGNLLYHPDAGDVSVVQAGRDIIYANFQVAGPGSLEISAGRNIYQADKGSIVSIGPLMAGDKRPGASILMQAGMGSAGPDYAGLAARYLDPANLALTGVPLADQAGKVAKTYEAELADWMKTTRGFAGSVEQARAEFDALPADERNVFLRSVYFAELRAGGREYNDPTSKRQGSYLRGREAIATLFPDRDASGQPIARAGDIILFGGSGVRTVLGGDIQMLAPGGQIVVGVEGQVPPASAGVITQGSGDIQMYAKGSVRLGLSRIMTTMGGDILAWSGEGDINAGRGAKTTIVYTPPRRVYDNYGRVELSPTVPSTGAGISSRSAIPTVPSGDIDLIAPLGTVDVGEAGVSGRNVNIAALQIVNAENIQAQGSVTGVPTVQAPNIGGLTEASGAAGAAAQQAAVPAQSSGPAPASIIIVEVIGFGGGDGQEREPVETRPLQQSTNLQRQDPLSAVQVIGAGNLSSDQRNRLTAEERKNFDQP